MISFGLWVLPSSSLWCLPGVGWDGTGVLVALTFLFSLLFLIIFGWLLWTCQPDTGTSSSSPRSPFLAELSSFSRMSMWWDFTAPQPTTQLRVLRLSELGASPGPATRAAEESMRSVGCELREISWGFKYRCSDMLRTSLVLRAAGRLSVSLFSLT